MATSPFAAVLQEAQRLALFENWRRKHTQGAEHGPPRVNDLNLAVPGEGLGVGRQASRVPAIVTRVLAWPA